MSTATLSAAEIREVDDRNVSVEAFVDQSENYFTPEFELIQKGEKPFWRMNIWALLIPWFWSAYRGLWLMFWVSLAIDVLAVVCLIQIFKYGPLLAEAQLDPSNNSTLIARYSSWIQIFGWSGAILFVLGRLWMGSVANSWYYGQYSRWRINSSVASGISVNRVITASLIIALVAPLTFYRASQQRLDERACLSQIRAGEEVDRLYSVHGVNTVDELLPVLAAEQDRLATRLGAIEALSELSNEQKTERSQIRKAERQAGRDIETVERFEAISAKDRFDCAFIDDFPTLARFEAPAEVRFRRVPDEEAIAAGRANATKVLRQEQPPVEGRRINIFTYNAEAIDTGINYLRAQYAGIFDAMTHVLRQSLLRVEVAFMLTPWPVMAFLFLALSWAYTSRATTIFVASSLAFLAVFELWQIAMQTMALVVVATAICVFVGLPVGIWMAKNKVARWITEPILDVMQTIPSLSYLVPAVAFFGISQPPAVLATVVFAIPPMVKLTALGIRQVPESTKEAALAFGASERQLLRKVELPMAIPSIMAGLNQTIMLALSMATISAFIGAAGLGALVTESLGDAQAGKGLLAGIAIALVAMMIDRILRGIRASFSRI